MDERKDRTRAEATCQRLGELAAATVPVEERAPDARQWAAVEARLDRRRVWRLVPALALGALAAMGTVTWLAARRTLDYRVQACTAAADGALTSVGAGTVSFADGSKVELETGARLRVRPAAFARGAELALEEFPQLPTVRLDRPRPGGSLANGRTHHAASGEDSWEIGPRACRHRHRQPARNGVAVEPHNRSTAPSRPGLRIPRRHERRLRTIASAQSTRS